MDKPTPTSCEPASVVAWTTSATNKTTMADSVTPIAAIPTSRPAICAGRFARWRTRRSDKHLLRRKWSELKRYIESAGAIDGLRKRYGKDKTFVVPILANMAIAGLVSWDEVAALPFEAAVFPQSMYDCCSMPVVSYAIPALVAIGQARHFHGRKRCGRCGGSVPHRSTRTMKVLRRMQPDSGGYLEATPLTSFVVMSLAVTARGDHEVSRSGLRFLSDSMQATAAGRSIRTWRPGLRRCRFTRWPVIPRTMVRGAVSHWSDGILRCQHRQRHPFTGAEPGGWGWSDLSGAVPDSDDTPAAILALLQQQRWVGDDLKRQCDQAIDAGIDWLRKLQNRDGGWPTFCRGWGKLPFDRSSNDLTAHALRAMWNDAVIRANPLQIRSRYARAIKFLRSEPATGWFVASAVVRQSGS